MDCPAQRLLYLVLTPVDCIIINEWFSFVGQRLRTEIDILLSHRICEVTKRNKPFSFNESELILMMLWFTHCPASLISEDDTTTFEKLTAFISEFVN